MEAVYFLNVGKVRKNNEDGLLVDDILQIDSINEPKRIEGEFKKIIVSDGMGGLDNGEVATKIVLEEFKNTLIKTEEDIETIIHKSANKFLPNSGCATAGISFKTGIVFNVGDCRVYKKIDIFLNQLTKDHTLARQMIDIGELEEEDISKFDKKNILTSAVMKDRVIQIYKKEIKIKKGDIFLICSDGLWGEFELEELEECFESSDITKIGDSIFQTLQNKPQYDNISFVVVKV